MIAVETVAQVTARAWGIAYGELVRKDRNVHLARPRQAAMWLAAEVTACSETEIGYRLGRRDRTTIRHGLKSIDKARDREPELKATLERLRAVLRDMEEAAEGLAGLPIDPLEEAARIVADDGASPELRALAMAVLAPPASPLHVGLMMAAGDVILAAHQAPDALAETVAGQLEPAFNALADAEAATTLANDGAKA